MTNNIDKTHNSVEEINLKELIVRIKEWYKYLLTKWLTILLFGLLGGAIGLIYAFLDKPVFTANTSFVLEEDKGGGGGLASLSGLASIAGVNIDGGGSIFQGDNILELYKSRTMIEKALLSEVNIDGKKQLLIDRYIQFNKLREKWSKKAELKDITFAKGNFNRLQDSILGIIVKDINKNYLNAGKPDKKMSIIKVSVKAEDEIFAKIFNDEIVKNVNEFYKQTKTKKSLENVSIIEEKRDSVRRVMSGAIYSAAEVSDATPNLNPTRQVQRLAPMQNAQFSAETNKAILSQLITNLEMAKITLRKETPLIQIIDEPIYPLEKEKFGKAKGLVIGGLLFGFLIVSFLTLKLIVIKILSSE